MEVVLVVLAPQVILRQLELAVVLHLPASTIRSDGDNDDDQAPNSRNISCYYNNLRFSDYNGKLISDTGIRYKAVLQLHDRCR